MRGIFKEDFDETISMDIRIGGKVLLKYDSKVPLKYDSKVPSSDDERVLVVSLNKTRRRYKTITLRKTHLIFIL